MNPVALPRSAAVFAFSILVVEDSPYRDYRVRIFDDRHRLIQQERRLTPVKDVLTVLLNADRFRSGDYSLVLEGYKKGGGYEDVGYYSFHIDFYSTALP